MCIRDSWWAAARSNDDGTEAYSVWAGRTDGKGAPKLLSPNDGRFHVNPATDGKTVVWTAYSPAGMDVLSRPLAGGPVKKLYSTTDVVQGVRVEGAVVVLEKMNLFGARHVGYLRSGDKEPTWVDGGGSDVGSASPSISGGRIAYAKAYPEGDSYRMGVEVLDLNSGARKPMTQLGRPETIGQTAVTGKHVYWLADEIVDQGQVAVRRANLDGTGTVDISPEKGEGALHAFDLTASDDAVTVTAELPDSRYRNESLAKLWQFGTEKPARARVSCNRGEQVSAAAAGGKQVVWIDGTTGYTDLVTRTRPAGTCG